MFTCVRSDAADLDVAILMSTLGVERTLRVFSHAFSDTKVLVPLKVLVKVLPVSKLVITSFLGRFYSRMALLTFISSYTPQCKECKWCKSPKTNLCQKIRLTQGRVCVHEIYINLVRRV